MKKPKMSFILLLVFLGGCGPGQPETIAAPAPTVASSLNFKPTSTPRIATVSVPNPTATIQPTALPTLPPPNIHEAQIYEINMMDETSGWASAFDRAYEFYLLHTSDGGQTWKDVTPGERTKDSFFLNGQIAWVILADESLVRTSDGGQTWKLFNRNLRDELSSPYPDWYRLRFTDANHGWLDGGTTAAGARTYFYETQDGGLTWNPSNFETLPDPYRQENSKNEIAFWIVTDVIYYDLERFIIAPALDEQEGTLNLFLSTDWGGSWKTVQLLPSAFLDRSIETREEISQPIFFDSQNGVLAVSVWDRDAITFELFVYGTSDGGLTWALTGGPSIIKDAHSGISFLSMSEAVFVCGFKFCVTNDSGSTWLALDFGIDTSTDGDHTDFQVDFLNPTTGWLLFGMNDATGFSLNSRLLKTSDGGLTWTEILPVINP